MNPQQKAAFRRKIYYVGAVLVLFTVSMFWRGILPVPLSTARASESRSGIQKAADRVNNATILNQARALDLRELEQGEPEVEGSLFRLAGMGSNGFLTTYLWYSWMDKQKRGDFHEMEALVKLMTWFQPHFITPWIFKAWNISYNVSVEMQGSGDMYHYIARGIDLLAEGERRNTHTYQGHKIGSPDMRWQIGFFYQNKFGVSDQVDVLRCLFELSLISPDERNPDDFIDKSTGEVKLPEFQRFCEKYPHLVRRLRGEDIEAANKSDDMTKKKVLEALKCPKPSDIIQFLRDNREILSRYTRARELAEPEKQFPILPPPFPEGEEEANGGSTTSTMGDDFTAFMAARAWYAYSLVPVPANQLDLNNEPLPSAAPRPATRTGRIRPDEYDPFLYRVPRSPMLIIFRHYPARTQTYQAEMEQKEGWFDNEGWRVDDPRDQPSKWWFRDPDPKSLRPLNLVLGKDHNWSLEHWQRASEMWQKHGREHGLIVSDARLHRYESDAQGNVTSLPMNPDDDDFSDVARRAKYEGRLALFFYPQNRMVSNFPFFLSSSEAEAQPETVAARKILWQAEQARKLGRSNAAQLYEDGLKKWKAVLVKNPNFHRPERSTHTEEETFTHDLAYLRLLIQHDEKLRTRTNEEAQVVASALQVAGAMLPFQPFQFEASLPYWSKGSSTFFGTAIMQAWTARDAVPEWKKESLEDMKWTIGEAEFAIFAGLITQEDGVNDERVGSPWIRTEARTSVLSTQGVLRKPNQQPQAPPTPLPVPSPQASKG
jgi:hypothetical protein